MKLRGSGLEVVLPSGVPEEYAAVFVQQNLSWIAKAVSRVGEQIAHCSTQPLFPSVIQLQGVGLTYNLEFQETEKSPSLAVNGSLLLLAGNSSRPEALTGLLLSWLRKLGHKYLAPWCRNLAEANHVPLQAVRIATPQKRWGSCNVQGTIMLNARLLLLPSRLCETVMYHELAHITHLNHSPKFWGHLQGLCPDALIREGELKDAYRYLPGWACMS
ncbi:M48 family metallopeptidase [Oleidesulfovibrio sp.]|uniref:M48 family metallopeptidase n=1 Tax=Oleidesulfovibrio sp. TaxID=2909707 RepID=UPI003A885EBF